VRGDAHVLLVGDPGMGKSQFLRYAARAAPRAVLTTGTGSTAAGLTAAAVRSESDAGGSSRRDESRWTLEAGALVLADGGACCVDEFDTIAPGERAAIHEAMEQQTLSVAKAGIVATLRARCAVLAATNPRGFAFDPQRSLAENTGLAPPLLSRFDCVLVLRDERDPARDERAATHMLASHRGVRATGTAERRRNRDASRPSKRARTASSALGPGGKGADRGGALLRAETIDGDRSDPEEDPPEAGS
jgi:DNA replicative helicase MCM subunit Mcm2 (Cdc46/Mcm family)